jgi:uncharacterized LabA/DUF88 family protein
MIFVDGENVAIRYKNIKDKHEPHMVKEVQDIYAWPESNFHVLQNHPNFSIIRSYYYTCVRGDEDKIKETRREIKLLGFESPCVFKKVQGKSKMVDISLCVDMVSQAALDNFDLCVLVTGDMDFVPAIEAVKRLGKKVVVWFFEEWTAEELIFEADHFFNLSKAFFKENRKPPKPNGISFIYPPQY